MMTPLFREVRDTDLPSIQFIYNYYIANSTCIAFINAISLEDVQKLVPLRHPKYKSYIIFERENRGSEKMQGFCFFKAYSSREAYDITAEVTLYLDPTYLGKGIGLQALNYLELKAKEQGIENLIALISGDNHRSIRLFQKADYKECARFPRVMKKFNTRLDLVGYQKSLD